MKRFLVLLLFVTLFIGCSSDPISVSDAEKDLEAITIELINVSELEEDYYYSFQIVNGSSRMISYVELAVGFEPTEFGREIGLKNESLFNADSIEQFNIEAGGTANFKVHIPTDLIVEGSLDFQDIDVNVVGFFDEIESNNRFSFMGDIEHYGSN